MGSFFSDETEQSDSVCFEQLQSTFKELRMEALNQLPAPPPTVSDQSKNLKTSDAYNTLYYRELAKVVSPDLKYSTGNNGKCIDKIVLNDGTELKLVGFEVAFEDAVSKVTKELRKEGKIDETEFKLLQRIRKFEEWYTTFRTICW